MNSEGGQEVILRIPHLRSGAKPCAVPVMDIPSSANSSSRTVGQMLPANNVQRVTVSTSNCLIWM